MLGFIVFALFANIQSAPVVGLNYDNIQYLHNLSLTYSNNSLEGLGAIDNFTDVNSQMAQSLKSAINSALPGYLVSSRSSTPPASSASSSASSMTPTGNGAQASTIPMNQGSSTSMPVRQKRQAVSTTTTTASPMSTSSPTPSQQPSTTQPYGTDEEFYARTDLVHFHVDINDLEGSGTI
ncbi:SEA domain-containing protein [Caenorhabditis elegans]|uniref:SEA domain-containing protein n=1 Tax=Caenorhabditis elegans TaxID=6239 RepID=O45945_CAEEL|nr:SEA domain-containing protein [Caenorhabditis elegans]CAA16377.1 SEA domain-containing protein [Caenorhabditis elegans]|eukprot:NP_502654.1 Uncharacterized protein CELE_Y45F10D.2 [Caenorhabditis elegans]